MSFYEIPKEAFDPKPFYRTRGDAEGAVREIKEHIRRTGEPHTWRHHTHSKPITESRIVYVGTFDLPTSHQALDRHAPCRCCSPRAPKYAHNGKIAWFPDEHVIRMIGPDCFQTLNPEGHWEAVAQFSREEAERRTIDYLVANLHLAGQAHKVIEKALPTLQTIDDVHATLQHRLGEIIHLGIRPHVRTGVLNVNVMGRRLRRTRAGEETVEEFLDIQRLSPLPGFQMFNPRISHLASRMKGCATRLGFIDFGDDIQERVRVLPQEERAKAARILSKGLSTALAIFDEAENIRSGFRTISLATLKGWSKHQGCPVHVYIAGDESNFYIGSSEH